MPLTHKRLLLYNTRKVLQSCHERVNIPRAESSLKSCCCPSLPGGNKELVSLLPLCGAGQGVAPLRAYCFPAGTCLFTPGSSSRRAIGIFRKTLGPPEGQSLPSSGSPSKAQWVGSSLGGGVSEEPRLRNQWASMGNSGLWRAPAPPHQLAVGALLWAQSLNWGVVRLSASQAPPSTPEAEQVEPITQTAVLPGNFVLRIGSGI